MEYSFAHKNSIIMNHVISKISNLPHNNEEVQGVSCAQVSQLQAKQSYQSHLILRENTKINMEMKEFKSKKPSNLTASKYVDCDFIFFLARVTLKIKI